MVWVAILALMFALDLFSAEKVEVVLKSHDLGLIVYQPSSEVSYPVGLLSLKDNGSLGLVRIFVTIKSEARKGDINWCSDSDSIDLKKKRSPIRAGVFWGCKAPTVASKDARSGQFIV